MTKIISFLKFIFQALILSLIILSLYPGSLLGLLFYGDLGKQPYFIENPFGTSINHFISYFFVSFLGLWLYLRSENFQKLFYGLFFLSITLEVLQFLIPHRSFQLYDLVGTLSHYLLQLEIFRFFLY